MDEELHSMPFPGALLFVFIELEKTMFFAPSPNHHQTGLYYLYISMPSFELSDPVGK